MHYDFVLRDVDPQIGPALAALAEILNERGEGVLVDANPVLSVDEQIEALAQLMEYAMPALHYYDQEFGDGPATAGPLDLFLESERQIYFGGLPNADDEADGVETSAWLIALADVFRLEALRLLNVDSGVWDSNPLAALIDCLRSTNQASWPAQLMAVRWLLDRIKLRFGGNVFSDEPPTSPWVTALQALTQLSQAITELLLQAEGHA